MDPISRQDAVDPLIAAVAHTPAYCASTWRLYGDPYGLMNTFYSDDDDGIASSSSARRAVAEEPSVLDWSRPEGRGSVRVKDGYSRKQRLRVCGDTSKPINYHRGSRNAGPLHQKCERYAPDPISAER